MLYSIIPPILIVLSLIGIIVLLMKKSAQVALLPEEVSDQDEMEKNISGNDSKTEDLKHFFLAVLEKMTRKSRVIFLKLESQFGSWSTDIRNKRKERMERKTQGSASGRENDIIRKLKDYRPGMKVALELEKEMEESSAREEEMKRGARRGVSFKKVFSSGNTPGRNQGDVSVQERIVRPVISEKAATPKKNEIRDRLEELLIERIAVNPKDIEAYERLGEYYMEIKSYNDAKECYKQVLKLNPTDRNSKYRMRRLENILAKQ
ncbi:MAG TPA: hypothetical protein DIT25_04440 [Candidatus Moranbacteria bacterium]|nr:hypothetical protein [Candidatus Moranbacteria bacterium]